MTQTKTKPAGQKAFYLSNRELFEEVKRSKERGEMTNELARMLQLLCSNYAKKGNYVNYSYNEDMQAFAMMMLVRTWNGFNPEKGSNAFAFFTQCIKNSFIQYLKKERQHRDLRDKMLIDQGLNPSYGYDDSGYVLDDEQDFDLLKSTYEAQTKTTFVDAPIERDENGDEIAIEITIDDPSEEPQPFQD